MASLVFIVCVTVILPISVFAFAVYKRRFVPFILGVLAYVISQMVIRIPLLEYLQSESASYLMWSVTYPVLFVIFLAISAGIFEELARWLAMAFIMKQRDRLSGILFGAGHGGIEAFLIVGLAVLPTISSIGDASVYWLGGFERLIAIGIHIGLSMIVLTAVKSQRFSFVLLAVGLHGAINSIASLLGFFSFSSPMMIEFVLLVFAVITLFIAHFISRKEDVR